MAKNRKKTEEFILKYIKKITGTDFNVNLYKDLFKSMNDKEFDKFMKSFEQEKRYLNIIAPLDKGAVNITVENNMKIAKEFGHDFFQRLVYDFNNDGNKIRSVEKFFVYPALFRRTKQTSEKGASVSENDKKIDILTGQVAGDSRSSKISFPEIQLLNGMGMKESIKELAQHRGGDEGAMRAIKQSLLKHGATSNRLANEYSTGTTSSKTLQAYLAGMHYKISL